MTGIRKNIDGEECLLPIFTRVDDFLRTPAGKLVRVTDTNPFKFIQLKVGELVDEKKVKKAKKF